jgi:hypothetical protein
MEKVSPPQNIICNPLIGHEVELLDGHDLREEMLCLINKEIRGKGNREQDVTLNVLISRIMCDLVRGSDMLDHITRLPHGLQHAYTVTKLMLDEIPESVPTIRRMLKDKYGRYTRILAAVTGLCHDMAYSYLAEWPLAFESNVFSRLHCKMSATIFRTEIAPLVREAFPDVPEEYIEDVEGAIHDHGNRYDEKSPLVCMRQFVEE